MAFLLVLPVIVSGLLLAAHFLRAGNYPMVLFSLAFPLLLLIKRPWAVRLVQIILFLGTLVWVKTLVVLMRLHIQMGLPWVKLVVILVPLALFTAASALIFFWSSTLKERYCLVKK